MKWLALALVLAACHATAPPRVVIENRADTSIEPDHRAYRGPITEASLEVLMSRRFAGQLAAGTFVAEFNGTTGDLLAELDAMGIRDLGQLARLIPPDYDHRAAFNFTTADPANIPGILRDVFIIHDARRYFREAWKSHWQSLSEENLPLYRAYHVDLGAIVEAGVMSRATIDASSPPRP